MSAERSEPAADLGPWPWIAALVALVFLAFLPALSGDFLGWDDEETLGRNYAFRGLDGPHLEWMFTTNHMGPYQPLAWLSFAVDHAIHGLGGPEVWPEAADYHRTSVAIHALAAVALFFLARRLLERPFAAFVAAAFFAIHPLRAESVAWVTERRDVLCGLFYVLAGWAWVGHANRRAEVESSPARLCLLAAASLAGGLLAWLAIDLSDPRRLALAPGGAWMLAASAVLLVGAAWKLLSPAAALALLFFLAALLSKGLALVLPFVLLVLDAWPFRRARDRPTFAACVVEKLPMVALAAVFARIAFWGQERIPGLMATWEEHTFAERTLQAFYGLAFYVRKTLLPTGLSPIYDLPAELRLVDLRFLLPVLLVLAITAFLVARRRRFPAVLAAWVAYGIAIAPVLGFSQTGPQLAADRYSYLACLPFALLAGAAVAARPGRTTTVAAAAVLLALGALGYAQVSVWRNSTTLWEHAHALDPKAMMNNLNLGHARVREAEATQEPAPRDALLLEAERLFEVAARAGDPPLAHSGLALVKQRQWQLDPRHPEEIADLSLTHARRALEIARARNVETPEYRLNLAVALGNAGHPNEAMDEFRAYVGKVPDSYLAHVSIGLLHLKAHDHAAAEKELERAVAIEPGAVDAWGNLGIAKQELGQREEAIRCFERVLALRPGHPGAQRRLFQLKSRVTVEVVPK